MNGRVYDYNVGRFMSVDPIIQGNGNSQGINPYSYIMNNPLAGTDPTGYQIMEVEGIRYRVSCSGHCPPPSDGGSEGGGDSSGSDDGSGGGSSGSGDGGNSGGGAPAPDMPEIVMPTTNGTDTITPTETDLGDGSISDIGSQGKLAALHKPGDGSGPSFGNNVSSGSAGSFEHINEGVSNFHDQMMNDSSWRGVAYDLVAGDFVGAYVEFSKGNYVSASMNLLTGLVKPLKVTKKVLRPLTSNQFSILFETKLSKSSYPNISPERHFQEANKNLHKQMRTDSEFANMMEAMHPGITKGIQPGEKGAYPRRAPTQDLTWHHGVKPGQKQLVPKSHHQAPGPVQKTLHPRPNGGGGMSIWGGGRQ